LRFTNRTLAAVAVAGLLAVGCSRAGGGSTSSASAPASSGSASSAATSTAGDFGSLKAVCQAGSASGAPGQGVTSTDIQIGVLTDQGFTKDPQLANAAKVFTAWCNAAGGINGRKLVANMHDTQLMAVVPAVTAACSKDFVLAGGSAALDGLGVATRLKCLMPDFDAQPVMPQNAGSDLQLRPYTMNFTYAEFAGYYKWLFSKYPDSKDHAGVLGGASVITEVDDKAVADTVTAIGGKMVYNGTYPVTGVTNWVPYAQAIKAKGTKGFTFYGTIQQLAALEGALDTIGYHLDWIDANTNAYGTDFIQLAGKALTEQNNYAQLPGIYPVEQAADNPAVEKIVQLYQQYAPGARITLQALQAWSMWLLFAQSATSCGANLTRSCVYTTALKQTQWTGGGITAPVDESAPQGAPACFNVEQASASGWKAPEFGANTGPYLCGQDAIKLPAGYPAAMKLADVGKSLSDLK
jgi:ABC-type branched-subunit amino acid transport system substrate-binding protein